MINDMAFQRFTRCTSKLHWKYRQRVTKLLSRGTQTQVHDAMIEYGDMQTVADVLGIDYVCVKNHVHCIKSKGHPMDGSL